MRTCLPTARSALALLLCPMAVSFAPSVAVAEETFVIKPVADKKLKALPTEVASKAWLFTLGAAGGSTPGGTKLAEVGPVPPITAPEYLLRITHSGGPPGARTPVHSHPGAEAFYVLSGRMGQKTPHGTTYTEAGQSMNGHGADMSIEVFNAGNTDLDQLVMFVVDATRPFAASASLH